jgi:hypothetical protein
LPACVGTWHLRLASKDKSPLAEAKMLSAATRIDMEITDATAKDQSQTHSGKTWHSWPGALTRYAIGVGIIRADTRKVVPAISQICLTLPIGRISGSLSTSKRSVEIIDETVSKISFVRRASPSQSLA